MYSAGRKSCFWESVKVQSETTVKPPPSLPNKMVHNCETPAWRDDLIAGSSFIFLCPISKSS